MNEQKRHFAYYFLDEKNVEKLLTGTPLRGLPPKECACAPQFN